MELTALEQKFMDKVSEEAYGGTLFTGDINPEGMSKAQKSGVVSSLVKKGIIEVDTEYGQIGIVGTDGEVEYEISRRAK